MSPLSEQLFELHVAHELARMNPSQIEQEIKTEIDNFLILANEKKLKDFISAEQVIASIRGAVKIDANLDKVIRHIVIAIYNDKIHDKTKLKNFIGDDELELFIDKSLSLSVLRNDLIQGVLKNKLVEEIFTDLLYSGISKYIAESNAIAQKVPGAKAMMNFGMGILKQAAPEFEDRIEYQIKKYIGKALPEIMLQSEKFIANAISDEGIKEISFEVWDNFKYHPLANIKKYISEQDVTEITDLVLQQIHSDPNADGDNDKKTNSNYVLTLIETGIKVFYKEYGNKKLIALMTDIDLTSAYLNKQITGTLPSIIEALTESGFLERRIRERLANFYQSDAAQNLLK